MKNPPAVEWLPARHKNDPSPGLIKQPGLTNQQTEDLAGRLRAIADPTRLRILDLLVQQPEPVCVCDLTPQFPQNQPTISHHLKLLRSAGLIDTEKRGIWSYYWPTEAGRRSLHAILTL